MSETPISAIASILRKAQGEINEAGEPIDVGEECAQLRRHFDAERAKVAELRNELRIQDEANDILTKHKEAAESQAARLRVALEEAPHAEGCASHGLRYARQIEQYCDCFKRVLQGEPK